VNGREAQIGFSQRIRLEWFEQTANLVLAGNNKASVNDSLQELLMDKISIGGQAVRGNREKVITILMKTWLTVPRGLETLRDEGLEILQGLTREDRIAVHWGMALAAYPFGGSVAAHTGRLLRLQGTAAAAHVQRRVREQYGERETVSRAARRVIQSFVDWDVLKKTPKKGIYSQGMILSIDNPRLISWLVEASLHARSNGAAALKDLLDNTGLFPFRLAYVSVDQLDSASTRLAITRLGINDDLVRLRKPDFSS